MAEERDREADQRLRETLQASDKTIHWARAQASHLESQCEEDARDKWGEQDELCKVEVQWLKALMLQPRTTRSGREYVPIRQMPLVVKGNNTVYVPWSFMDMIGLAGRLPEFTEGANKWITALEENTG